MPPRIGRSMNSKQMRNSDRVIVRANQSLNNIIEQYHRRVNARTRPMFGFKVFAHATIVATGIERASRSAKVSITWPGS